MERDGNEPEVLAVAGCLFEVSMPERASVSWRWAGGQPEITLLGESVRGGRRHFRFRAEAAGTAAIRFRAESEARGTSTRIVSVPVAPEKDPSG